MREVEDILGADGVGAVLDRIDAVPRHRLDEILAALEARPLPPHAAAALPYARPQAHAPLVIGHRGDPTSCVENTLPGIASAFRLGADAVEIDVLLVKTDDGYGHEAILRHDPLPGGFRSPYAAIRNLGLEPRVYADDLFKARPTTPPIWRRSLRRPSHELTLAQYRAHYGYAEVKSWPFSRRRLAAEIPTLDQVGRLLADDWKDKGLFLDTRVPDGRPDLVMAMAARIDRLESAFGLDPRRIIVGNADRAILDGLREALGREYRYSFDAMLIGPFAKAADASAHANAVAFDTDLGDVGHVFWGSDDELLKAVERDVPAMHRDGKQIVVWTVNDAVVFRKLLGVGGRTGGGIDMVITDRPAQFRERIDGLGLRRAI